MASIGPELPPHLAAKRKRQAEAAAAAAAAPPETSGNSSPSIDSSKIPEQSKKPRILGPAAPPAPLDERPAHPPDAETAATRNSSDSSDEDEDYGPALPTVADAQAVAASTDGTNQDTWSSIAAREQEQPKQQQRDEWMLVPPTQDDLAARIDPTKLRARKFNSGKGPASTTAKGTIGAMWTETPEEKRKRLRDEMMGTSAPAQPTNAGSNGLSVEEQRQQQRRKAEQDETLRRIKDHNDRYRGQSLYEQHQTAAKAAGKDAEADDPSKRGFDYEKDIAGGGNIGYTQRKQMMRNTTDFASKFTKGSYT